MILSFSPSHKLELVVFRYVLTSQQHILYTM